MVRLLVVTAINRNELVHRFNRSNAHGSAKFVQFSICADVANIVVTKKSEVLHQLELRREITVVGRYRAAFEAVNKFGCVKTEHLGGAESADLFALKCAS